MTRFLQGGRVGALLCLLFLSPAQFLHAAGLGDGEWYVRLIAEAPRDQLRDQGNVLGMLNTSEDLFDRHDLKELPPFTAPYLSIVFPKNNWGEHKGNYASDYRKRRDSGKNIHWRFVVRSDAPRRVTLRWNSSGGRRLLESMWLVDLESGKRVKAVVNNKLNSYTFTMTGKWHRFKWIYAVSAVSKKQRRVIRTQS